MGSATVAPAKSAIPATSSDQVPIPHRPTLSPKARTAGVGAQAADKVRGRAEQKG